MDALDPLRVRSAQRACRPSAEASEDDFWNDFRMILRDYLIRFSYMKYLLVWDWKSVKVDLVFTYHIARLAIDRVCLLSQGTSCDHKSRLSIVDFRRRAILLKHRTFVAIIGHGRRLQDVSYNHKQWFFITEHFLR